MPQQAQLHVAESSDCFLGYVAKMQILCISCKPVWHAATIMLHFCTTPAMVFLQNLWNCGPSCIHSMSADFLWCLPSRNYFTINFLTQLSKSLHFWQSCSSLAFSYRGEFLFFCHLFWLVVFPCPFFPAGDLLVIPSFTTKCTSLCKFSSFGSIEPSFIIFLTSFPLFLNWQYC